MAVLQDININVHGQPSEKRLQTFLRLSQNENGRMINFRVLGPPLPSGCTATFSGTKPDGNVYSKTGTVTGNFVVIQEDMQMTAVAGVWDAKLDIINGSHNIMTALIRVVVDADVVDPDAIASDSQLQGLVAEAKYYAEHARTDAYGSPLTASTKSAMTDHTRVYVYTGSESGMTAGNWYYWNDTAWTSGGVYNSVAVQFDTELNDVSTNPVQNKVVKAAIDGVTESIPEIDATLSTTGKAADAKKTGDEISGLKEEISDTIEQLGESTDSVTVTDNLLSMQVGVTVEKESDDQIKVYGTATAARHFGVFNGQNFIKDSSSAFVKTLDAGTYYIESSVNGVSPEYLIRGTYTTFSNWFIVANQLTTNGFVTFDAPVMLAFTSVKDTVYGTEENPTIITFTAKKITAKDPVARAQSATALQYVSQISESAECATFTEDLDVTDGGVTVRGLSDNQAAIYGTATAWRHFGFLNGQHFIKDTRSAFVKTLDAGTYEIECDLTGAGSGATFVVRGTYTTFANNFTVVDSTQKKNVITLTDPAMLAFTSVKNAVYGTEENPSTFSFSAKKITAVDWVLRAQSATALQYVSQISESAECATFTEDLDVTDGGVTVRGLSDNQAAIYGTATAMRHFGFLNGQHFIKDSSSAFVKTLDAGTYEIECDLTGAGSGATFVVRGTYTTFANNFTVVDSTQKKNVITLTDPAMLAFTSVKNAVYGTEENPSTFSFSAKKITAVDWVLREKAMNAIQYSEQPLTDSQQEQARINIDTVGNDTLYRYNFFDALKLASSSGDTYNGITYTKNSNGTWTIDGTADGQSFRNLIESTDAVPRYIIPGRKYKFLFHDGTIPINLYIYKNGSIDSRETYTEDFEVTIPEDIGGIILRFQIADGTVVDNVTVNYEFVPETVTSIDNRYTYNTTVNKTEQIYNNTFNITSSPTITTGLNGWLQAVDTDTADETGKTDMAPAIMTMLNATGYCHLGEGIFYVSGNIDMPPRSTLEGCGQKTVIRLLQSVTDGYCIKIQKYNTISDLMISGGPSDISVTSQGSRTGILFAANNDGQEGESAYESEACLLSNLWVHRFSDSGIKCHNTSMNIRRGIYATNLYVVNCWAGINIDYYSEFNKFTNICISACYYGCINNGGNNVFTGCTFHATYAGFYIDGTQPNSAHGTINGCTFCHIGSNNGYAVKANDVAAGFIIANCQIWYCGIDLTNCEGMLFDGCEFGRGRSGDGDVSASITISGGNLVMFNGCMFRADVSRPPKITITNNSKVRFNGCYGTESGDAIGA